MLSWHENGTMRAMPENSTTKNPGFFGRLRQKLSGGKGLGLTFGLSGHKLDAELEEKLETQLLLADVGIEATDRIISGLRRKIGGRLIKDDREVRDALCESLIEILKPHAQPLEVPATPRPFLILVVGVNGSGKTTTIGKIAKKTHEPGPVCHVGRRRHGSRGGDRATAGMG